MEEFKGDKRTKEYKEWKAKFEAEQSKKPEGLGDVVEKITEATGIKAAVEFIAGKDCGCDKRKKKLNEIFLFAKPKCLEEDEYHFISDTFKVSKRNFDYPTKLRLYEIYNRVFNVNLEPQGQCTKCMTSMIKKLEAIINTYN